jgi:hypothetical protein
MSKPENFEEASVVDDLQSDWRLSGDVERIASLLVALAYLVVSPFLYPAASWSHFMADMIMRILSLAFPLACIWFADELAEYFQDGNLFPEITTRSPSVLVKVGGWILLLLPILIFLLNVLLEVMYG